MKNLIQQLKMTPISKLLFAVIPLSCLILASCTGGNSDKKAEALNQKEQIEEEKQSSHGKQNDWTNINIHGKVRSISDVVFKGVKKNGEITKSKRLDSLRISFNNEGYKIEEIGYNTELNYTNKSNYKDNNINPPELEYLYRKMGCKFLYKYGTKNNLIEESIFRGYDDGSLWFKTSYKYDETGNRIEGLQYTQDSVLDIKLICKYDNNGNLIEKKLFQDEVVFSRKTFSHNANEKAIEILTFKRDSSLEKRGTFVYDSNGNLIEANLYKSNGSSIGKSTYVYDDKGNQVERSEYSPNGKLKVKISNRFNDKNNIIEQSEFNADGSLKSKYTIVYDYDNNMNWIKRTMSNNKGTILINERELSYY